MLPWEGVIGKQSLGMKPGAHGKEPPTMPATEKAKWPIGPSSTVYHGPIGDFVQEIAADTEADPIAVLGQALVMFGSRIGRKAFVQVGADKHFANDFLMLIGSTSGGRKGTSVGVAKSLFDWPEPDALCLEPKNGLSSAEGLIWAVRDPVGKEEGVDDKRLLVVEPEFASVLRQTERHGNTLSALLRQCWECGNLSTMTKNSPAKATGAHVSVIGHMTAAEVDRYFTRTEMANGFGNRFLWLTSRRSKLIPEPKAITPTRCRKFRERLGDALDVASQLREVERTPDAWDLWKNQYQFLERERKGLAGDLLARASQHVIRLSLIYCLADGKTAIGKEHLSAALELWRYSERCIEYLFPNSTGDPIGDKVLNIVKDRPGISRKDLIHAMGNHVAGERLTIVIERLEHEGFIEMATHGGKGSGSKPCETYYAA